MTDAAAPLAEPAPAPGRKAAPWRGRRRVPDPKGRFVAVRCTDAEHAALTAAAAQAGLSVGAYLRAQGLGSPGPRAVRRVAVERTELARALGLLGHYGSNLNQLARVANTNGELPTAGELETMAGHVRELRAVLMKALGRGD